MNRLHIAAVAVAILAALVYANALQNGFALDDEFIILRNQTIQGFDRVDDDALTSPYWPGAPGRIAMYRPVTSASFALEWDLWGADRPAGYHFTNVLLHALVTVLVLLLLHALAGLRPAIAGAALFAVHPVHVEAVANIVGRGELLAAAFFLAAVLVYTRSGKSRGAAAAIGVLYFLAVASKEIGVTLPLVLLIIEAVRPGAMGGWQGWFRRSLERWPVYAAAALGLGGYLAARILVLDTALGNDPAPFLQGQGSAARIWTALAVWPEYARLLVYPRELVADYSPGVLSAHATFDAAVAAGVAVGLVAAALVALSWRRAPLVAAGVAWFAFVVLPVSNLFFPIGIMLAERTLYLPSVGLSLAVAGAGGLLLSRHSQASRLVALPAAVVLLLMAGRTWTRTPTWESSATVMADLAAEHPESFRVQWIVADRLLREGRREEGLARLRLALDMMPAHYQLRFQYGRALLDAGRMSEAAAQLDMARRLIPEHPEAPILLAAVLVRLERWEEALGVAEEAAARFPAHRGAWHQLALARGGAGDVAGALAARRVSLDLGGSSAHWLQWVHLAELHLRLGSPVPAEAALARARDAAPEGAAVPTPGELAAAIDGRGGAALPYR